MDDEYNRNHVTSKMAEHRKLKLQYLNVQHDGRKPAHERLSDPRCVSGSPPACNRGRLCVPIRAQRRQLVLCQCVLLFQGAVVGCGRELGGMRLAAWVRCACFSIASARPSIRYATGVYRQRFEDFGPDHDFRHAMQRRMASRQREMKAEFPLQLRQTREDMPRHARQPPKQYDSYLREQFSSSSSDASSFLRQAARPDDEQALSPLSTSNGGRGGTMLPGIRNSGGGRGGGGKATHRTQRRRNTDEPEATLHVHSHYEVKRPKDFKERKDKLLATLAKFNKVPRGEVP